MTGRSPAAGIGGAKWQNAAVAVMGAAFAFATGTATARPAKPRPAPSFAVTNAEDLAPIDANRAIASSMAGGHQTSGALFLADRNTKRLLTLFPGGNVAPRPAVAGCDAPVSADAFKPHGIALRTDEQGVRRLYVVNHGARESVEMFRLNLAPRPNLTWTGCAIFPAGAFGNAVAITSDGSFYATNQGAPLGGGESTGLMGGEVVSWRADRGWAVVPRSAAPGANGVLLSPDEKTIFVAGWSARTLLAVPLDTTRPTRSIALPFMPDNLRWSPRGSILATGHATAPESVVTCYVSTSTICGMPSGLAEVDPSQLTQTCSRALPLGLSTVTVEMGRELWIGSARNNRIERIAGPPCKGDAVPAAR